MSITKIDERNNNENYYSETSYNNNKIRKMQDCKPYIYYFTRLNENNDRKILIDEFYQLAADCKPLYESLNTETTIVHPYVDLDLDKSTDISSSELISITNELISSTNDSKYNFTIAGYTDDNSLINEFPFLEYKQYKKLSIHIVIDCSIDRRYLYDYVTRMYRGTNVSKYLDTSVLKGCKRGTNDLSIQKFRTMFSDKHNGNTIEHKAVQSVRFYKYTEFAPDISYIDYTDKKYTDMSIDDFSRCLLTVTNDDCEPIDVAALQLKTKAEIDNDTVETVDKPVTKTADGTACKPSKIIDNDKHFIRIPIAEYFRYWDKLITVGKYNEILYTTEYLDGFSYVPTLVSNSPYSKADLSKYLANWYNSIQHNHPEAIIEYIDKNYKQKYNNIYISLILKRLQIPKFADTLAEDELEEYYTYKQLKQTLNKRLSPKKRILKKNLCEKYDKQLDEFNASVSRDYSETIELRESFNQCVLHWGVISVNRRVNEKLDDFNYKYHIFRDSSYKLYVKNSNGEATEFARNDILNLEKINPDNLRKLAVISIDEYERESMELRYLDKPSIDVSKFCECYKHGFVYSEDYDYYMRYIGMKLRNKTIINRNLIQLEGSGSFKTSFLDSISKFVKIAKIDFNTALTSQFNGYMNSDICVIDEIPRTTSKDLTNIQNKIKQITSTKYLTINEKYQKPYNITNVCNLIINSNYKNCGDILKNQSSDSEIFRRFKIIRKHVMTNDDKQYCAEFLHDEHSVISLIEYLKQLEPMNNDELYRETDFERWMYDFVKNVDENYRVFNSKTQLMEYLTPHGKNYRLNIRGFCKELNYYNIRITQTALKNLLMDKQLLKIENTKYVITELDSFYELFVDEIDECENDTV